MSWWKKFGGKSGPHSDDLSTKPAIARGNHIENLRNYPSVQLEPSGTLAELDLPIWVQVSPKDKTDQTYENLLWEIEPMGEYVYFLAGNFPKNEKGLLRYASAKTRLEVFVCYEDDVVDVRKWDEAQYTQHAADAVQDHTDFADMTIRDTWTFAQDRGRAAGYDRSFIKLWDKRADVGWCYARCGAPHQDVPTFQINCTILDETGKRPRVTVLQLWSIEADQKIGPLCEAALTQLAIYQSISHHNLSGAIRM
ncbi:MAG: hypothetical protein ABJN69_03360 [Hellea sp.]